jgi:hypothetical protein
MIAYLLGRLQILDRIFVTFLFVEPPPTLADRLLGNIFFYLFVCRTGGPTGGDYEWLKFRLLPN